MPKEMRLLYVFFQTVPLYIVWDQFITVQVTLLIPYHQVTFNVLLVFKRLHMNLFNVLVFCNLRVVLGDRPTGPITFFTIFILSLSKSNLPQTKMLWLLISVVSQNIIFFDLSINFLCLHLHITMNVELRYHKMSVVGYRKF